MTTLIILAFLCLCIGVLLIGLATVKEAFWPVPMRRIEIGSVAVEHRGGDTHNHGRAPVGTYADVMAKLREADGFGSKSDAAWFDKPAPPPNDRIRKPV